MADYNPLHPRALARQDPFPKGEGRRRKKKAFRAQHIIEMDSSTEEEEVPTFTYTDALLPTTTSSSKRRVPSNLDPEMAGVRTYKLKDGTVRWRASIYENSKSRNLGSFASQAEAVTAHVEAREARDASLEIPVRGAGAIPRSMPKRHREEEEESSSSSEEEPIPRSTNVAVGVQRVTLKDGTVRFSARVTEGGKRTKKYLGAFETQEQAERVIADHHNKAQKKTAKVEEEPVQGVRSYTLKDGTVRWRAAIRERHLGTFNSQAEAVAAVVGDSGH
jgi:hypothetical protein